MLILLEEWKVFAFSLRKNDYFARMKRPFFSLLLSYNWSWLLAKSSTVDRRKSDRPLLHSFLSFYKVHTAKLTFLSCSTPPKNIEKKLKTTSSCLQTDRNIFFFEWDARLVRSVKMSEANELRHSKTSLTWCARENTWSCYQVSHFSERVRMFYQVNVNNSLVVIGLMMEA